MKPFPTNLPTKLKPLVALISNYEEMADERGRLENLQPLIESQETELTLAGKFDDPQVIAQLAALHTKQALLPVKIRSLDKSLELSERAISVEASARALDYARMTRNHFESARGKVVDYLMAVSPFGPPYVAEKVLEPILSHCAALRPFYQAIARGNRSFSDADGALVAQARELALAWCDFINSPPKLVLPSKTTGFEVTQS